MFLWSHNAGISSLRRQSGPTAVEMTVLREEAVQGVLSGSDEGVRVFCVSLQCSKTSGQLVGPEQQ